VSNLLEMTRLESGVTVVRREPRRLEGVVGAALTGMGRRLGGHPVSTDLPATLPPVSIDGALIQQVFLNLLDNAVKYTPEGCPIEITARASDGEVTVSVADRGPGLPADVLERIFEKFYRAKTAARRGGAGLGLTICRAIVQAHGGRIWAENRPGGGLVFHFTLPLSEQPATAPGGV
jgi:two-component system sensor histidine kinase KdpD